MKHLFITPRRRRGRPNRTPPGRDQQAELQHLRTWWQVRQPDLPPLARLARRAQLHPDTLRHVLQGATPATRWLDQLYPILQHYGYVPLPPPAASAIDPASPPLND